MNMRWQHSLSNTRNNEFPFASEIDRERWTTKKEKKTTAILGFVTDFGIWNENNHKIEPIEWQHKYELNWN